METITSSGMGLSDPEKITDTSMDQQMQSITQGNTEAATASPKKPFSFYLSVLLLGLVGMVVALDATSLIVALPVSASRHFHGPLLFR